MIPLALNIVVAVSQLVKGHRLQSLCSFLIFVFARKGMLRPKIAVMAIAMTTGATKIAPIDQSPQYRALDARTISIAPRSFSPSPIAKTRIAAICRR